MLFKPALLSHSMAKARFLIERPAIIIAN